MILIIVAIIGYLMGGDVLGGQIINAFEYLVVLYIVVAIILGIVLIALLIRILVFKKKGFGFTKKIVPFLGGISIAIVVVVGIGLHVYLAHYIIDTTPPTADTFAELPQNTKYAIYAWGTMMLFNIFIAKRR